VTKAQAHQCLSAVREGRFQPKPRINEALRTTGDLPPLSQARARRMPNFGRPSKVIA
jgi:hypothetical protein